MRRNLSTALPQRWRPGGMAAFDRLPPPLRAWLAQAALPWSPASALRIWRAAPDPAAALARLAAVEAATLARDRPGAVPRPLPATQHFT